MVRVLHLLSKDADDQSFRQAEGLARALGPGFAADIRRLGRGAYRNGAAAVMALRRGGAFELVHAWGAGALTVGAMGQRGPIVYSPSPEATRSDIAWARAVLAHRRVEVVCPTATLRRRHVESGVPVARCHLIRPGVEFAKARRRRDPDLRARLGWTDADHVLLAAGHSTRAAAHTDAAWATSILHILDPRYKLLLWGGPLASKAHRLGLTLCGDGVVAVAERTLGAIGFESLLPAADTVLVSAAGATATLPICIAMAAGLPIVSTVTYTTGELLEDRHTALMTRPRAPRKLAQRVLDLHADPSLQWSIADMARTEAYEFFSFTRFLDQFRAVYRQLAEGQPVSVPEPLPGAGRRFHVRGER